MKTWRDHTNELAAEAARQRAEQAAREADQAELRGTPMTERIRRLLRPLPPEERVQPRTMEWFVEQLKPRWSGRRASPRDVGAALRHLGWTRTRAWRRTETGDEIGFRAYWLPPKTPKDE